jgi:hypothetical protein
MRIRWKYLEWSALAITRFFGSLENDKFLWADVPTIAFFGGEDDKAGRE